MSSTTLEPSIEWRALESGALRGKDQHGNRYAMPANQDTCSVTLTDGRKGAGWTAREAFFDAMTQETATPSL